MKRLRPGSERPWPCLTTGGLLNRADNVLFRAGPESPPGRWVDVVQLVGRFGAHRQHDPSDDLRASRK